MPAVVPHRRPPLTGGAGVWLLVGVGGGKGPERDGGAVGGGGVAAPPAAGRRCRRVWRQVGCRQRWW